MRGPPHDNRLDHQPASKIHEAPPLAQAASPVVYRVGLARAGETSVAVSLVLPADAQAPATLVIPRAVPMVEAMAALVLADHALRHRAVTRRE